jgi:hypothetical protein
MQLFLRDPSYTDRLAAFLTSVGRRAVVSAPDRVDIDETPLTRRTWSSSCTSASGASSIPTPTSSSR